MAIESLSCILAVWTWHSQKLSVSRETLLKEDCAVLSCSLQPVSNRVTKPRREGWNAIWEVFFSARSLAHRVGWKSASGVTTPSSLSTETSSQLLPVFGFPLGSHNLACRNHLQRTTVTVMFLSYLAWTPSPHPCCCIHY